MRRLGSLAAMVVALCAPSAAQAGAGMRDILLVGNNWDGTADVVDAKTLQRLDRINVVPDRAEREQEVMLDPERQAYFLLIQQAVGEGHDQLVDDMFSSNDGRRIFVSRPSFADVVCIDLKTHKIVWRRPVDGYRADHMAISPDGTRLAVSASTANVVDMIDTATGRIVGSFPSGDSPHENNFSRDGSLIYHASIGRVYVPTTDPATEQAKGDRHFEIVDAKTLKVLRTFDIAQKLADFGRPNQSPAIRPMALSPDERWLYLQISYLHGIVEYDLATDRVTRVLDLPALSDQYVLNSAHHGLQMSPDGRKLCVAGTIDNYIAIVHRDDFSYRTFPSGTRPYWANNSADGRFCYVSIAGDDRISVVSYRDEAEVASIPVGDHPQRNRDGRAAADIYGPAPRSAGSLSMSARRVGARRVRVQGRLAFPAAFHAAACAGSVRVHAGRRAVRVPLRAAGRTCTFSRTLAAPRRAARVRARVVGNTVLGPVPPATARL